MSPIGGIWAPMALRIIRKAALTSTKMIRSKLAAAGRPLASELQTVPVRAQPVHPKALLRQTQRAGARWFSTNGTRTVQLQHIARRFLSKATAPSRTIDRSKLPVSNISRAVSQLPGRAPFASTLRPNLTGGALPRTAGGYSATGAGRVGGVRYFSHTPAAPAQVVQNVSQAVRAFWLSGQRARYDGVDAKGRSRYVSVSATQEEMRVKMAVGITNNMPGSFVDFKISPTITALSPLGAAMAVEGIFGPTAAAAAFKSAGVPAATLNTEGFLDVLSTDFARALKDLSATMTDLKKLAVGLGDLPVTMEKNNILRVRFPGVDGATVERLMDDFGVLRGMVGEEAAFRFSQGVPVALKFPFAPGAEESEVDTLSSPGGSLRSHDSILSEEADEMLDEFEENPWLSSPSPEEEGYESLSPPVCNSSAEHASEDFKGLEGIYRFLEECDRARNPF